jgi:hypothetical protein
LLQQRHPIQHVAFAYRCLAVGSHRSHCHGWNLWCMLHNATLHESMLQDRFDILSALAAATRYHKLTNPIRFDSIQPTGKLPIQHLPKLSLRNYQEASQHLAILLYVQRLVAGLFPQSTPPTNR